MKTLSDADAVRVDTTRITATTIAAMNALPAHCSSLPEARTFPEEFQVYELTGRVTFVAQEDDRDYHLALADPDAPDQMMIVESPDPQCEGAVASPYIQKLRDARQMLLTISGGRPAALVGRTVRVQGVGFYDFDHGQRGRSSSCIELHPILRIE